MTEKAHRFTESDLVKLGLLTPDLTLLAELALLPVENSQNFATARANHKLVNKSQQVLSNARSYLADADLEVATAEVLRLSSQRPNPFEISLANITILGMKFAKNRLEQEDHPEIITIIQSLSTAARIIISPEKFGFTKDLQVDPSYRNVIWRDTEIY